MATLTKKTFLMKGTTSGSTTTYSKLVDIKDYPDMKQTPDAVQTTTLTDLMHTYIPGLDDPGGAMPFTANYSEADYAALEALKDIECDLALWLGGTEANGVATPTGSDGKFEFKGYVTVRLVGKGVGEVREMEIAVMPSSAVTFNETQG